MGPAGCYVPFGGAPLISRTVQPTVRRHRNRRRAVTVRVRRRTDGARTVRRVFL